MSDTAARPAETVSKETVARTPLAERTIPPGEFTVRFRRWHSMNGTAYQAGTFAGFPRAVAQDLAAKGLVDLEPVREPAPNRMVRK